MAKLPGHLSKYFWEVEFESLDLDTRRAYILKRILEYGDEEAVSWMLQNFDRSEIRDVLRRFRGISRKSANFWAIVLDIPEDEVECLKKSSTRAHERIWPY